MFGERHFNWTTAAYSSMQVPKHHERYTRIQFVHLIPLYKRADYHASTAGRRRPIKCPFMTPSGRDTCHDVLRVDQSTHRSSCQWETLPLPPRYTFGLMTDTLNDVGERDCQTSTSPSSPRIHCWLRAQHSSLRCDGDTPTHTHTSTSKTLLWQ